jgi:REP element-mobilizing transposase RayT
MAGAPSEGARPARRDGETPPLQETPSEGARPARQGGETPPLQETPSEGARSARQGGETPPLREHRGWHAPHKLPHFDSPEIVQAITFRLADALPRGVSAGRRSETPAGQRQRIAAALDAGFGACLFRDHALAEIVEAALLRGAGTKYGLFSWVVMPNHVHELITLEPGHRLADIVQGWKSWTAKAINRRRSVSGQVWQRDYFDRFIRDERHLAAALAYIENNPVKAGLAASAEDWPFGSASRRSARQEAHPMR